MARRRKPAVQRYHDRVAPNYDHSYDDAFWQWHDALAWDHIRQFLPVNQRAPVLDLGCGTGKWAAKLSKSGYSVTCVDISHRMLEQARHKLAELNDQRAAFQQADLTDLSALPGGHFALALAMGDPIGCTESPPKALKEIRRVLASDGVLVATFDNRLNALEFYMQAGDATEMEAFLHTGRTHWLTRDRDEQFEIHTYTPIQLRKMFEVAGYDVLDLIGMTVLPLRTFREQLLGDPAQRRAWLKIEKSLHRDEAAIGRASHLQIAARPRPE